MNRLVMTRGPGSLAGMAGNAWNRTHPHPLRCRTLPPWHRICTRSCDP